MRRCWLCLLEEDEKEDREPLLQSECSCRSVFCRLSCIVNYAREKPRIDQSGSFESELVIQVICLSCLS